MSVERKTFDLTSRSRLVGVGVHDSLTAALVADAGFDVAWVGSFEASTYRLLPDANLVTCREIADDVRMVRSGCRLPVLVDADNGYGSDECAVRAARLFAEAGADGMCIEDSAFPKFNSLYSRPDRALEDPAVFARRLEKLGHAGTGLKIVARTEALVVGLGPDEAVARLRRYADAGVDGLFVQTSTAHADRLMPVLDKLAELALPVVLAPTALPRVTADEFHAAGANLVLFANVISRAMVRGTTRMLAQLRRTRSLHEISDQIADLDEIFKLTDALAWNSA